MFDPDKIKAVIDHVTPAKDFQTALQGKILRDWAHHHNIKDFLTSAERVWSCHFPGRLCPARVLSSSWADPDTCTHGAFGAFAAGWAPPTWRWGFQRGMALTKPDTLKIDITGQLRPGVFAKDVILEVIRQISVNGATNQVIEFCGPVVDAMTMEGRMNPVQYGGGGRGHLGYLPTGRGDRGLSVALYQGGIPGSAGSPGRFFPVPA
ncbi:MAG: aconitase family protein [Desulfotignum sp.]|nr:aconitase family protein [Desulfotignum sp.]